MTNQTADKLQQDLRMLESDIQARDVFRLAQARNSALSQVAPKQKNRFLPVLGASMASVLLAAFFFFEQAPLSLDNETINDYTAEESYFEFDDENIDLYEDLDFYYWLAANDPGATG
jgi:hypothetical protein